MDFSTLKVMTRNRTRKTWHSGKSTAGGYRYQPMRGRDQWHISIRDQTRTQEDQKLLIRCFANAIAQHLQNLIIARYHCPSQVVRKTAYWETSS